MKHIFFVLFPTLVLLGCEVFNPKIRYPQSESKISAVLVIIEDSYIGKNKGAVSDMLMMSNMVSTVTDDIVILKNGYATKKNVKESIRRACSNDLAIVFFTCHGGQEKAEKHDREFETDGKDEFIFLSDSSITDNELWDIFKTSTNRVFTIFNCCHAGTMFRSSAGLRRTGPAFSLFGNSNDGTRVNLLSWSACGDPYYAVTSRDGGEFVKSLSRVFNAFNGNVTYNSAWTVIHNSSDLRKYQKPDVHMVGDYEKFENVQLFK